MNQRLKNLKNISLKLKQIQLWVNLNILDDVSKLAVDAITKELKFESFAEKEEL